MSRIETTESLDRIVAILGLAPWFAKVCINYNMNQARLHLDKGL